SRHDRYAHRRRGWCAPGRPAAGRRHRCRHRRRADGVPRRSSAGSSRARAHPGRTPAPAPGLGSARALPCPRGAPGDARAGARGPAQSRDRRTCRHAAGTAAGGRRRTGPCPGAGRRRMTPPAARRTARARSRLSKAEVHELFARLAEIDPEPTTELEYGSAFELLVAVVLSAQATDVGVNKVTRRLYPVANTPQAILDLGEEALRKHISTIGLFNAKARNVMALC